MHKMTGIRRQVECGCAIVSCCALLWLSQGCVRQEPIQPGNATLPVSQQGLPFHNDHASADDGRRPAVPADAKAASALPFRSAPQSGVLPSGTLLTVQLEDSLSTTKVRAGDTFRATMATSFTVGGDVIVDRGASVIGRVESAQSQRPRAARILGPGYFRLSLTAITVAGRQVALQTSSLFTHGDTSPTDRHSIDVQVQKGRRLTFRLTAPAVLGDRDSMADRQYLSPTSE
jgi:hypothetical protein